MRLRNKETSDPEQPIEINRFRMLVPQAGYCWLEDAYPSRDWGEENRRTLNSGPPYMAVNGLSSPARVYHPFKDTPDLFLKFKDLSLDRDSLVRFANEYGWLGERGIVEYRGAHSVRAVGFSTWTDQIQKMTIADRLLNWVRNKDQHALSRHFVWHPDRFDVQVRIEMDGKGIVATKAGCLPNPDRVCFWGWLVGSRIMPYELPELRKLGWRRSDFTRPALLIAAGIINEQLGQLCRPMLTMDHKNACLRGYWTANNLLGCIWLQFYLSVIGQLKLRKCTVCGREMDVSDSRRSKRVHQRCSKNERQARWRAGRKGKTSKAKPARELGRGSSRRAPSADGSHNSRRLGPTRA
jgi:hypothetical protein